MSSETNSIDQMPKKSPLSFQVDLKKFEKATDEEKRQQDVMSESVSFFKDGMRKLMKNPLAVGSIIVLIVIIAMILIVPHVVPYKYSQIITVNGSRDTWQRAEKCSLTSWERTAWDVIISSVLFTEPGFL